MGLDKTRAASPTLTLALESTYSLSSRVAYIITCHQNQTWRAFLAQNVHRRRRSCPPPVPVALLPSRLALASTTPNLAYLYVFDFVSRLVACWAAVGSSQCSTSSSVHRDVVGSITLGIALWTMHSVPSDCFALLHPGWAIC